jgi:hypothetical protein
MFVIIGSIFYIIGYSLYITTREGQTRSESVPETGFCRRLFGKTLQNEVVLDSQKLVPLVPVLLSAEVERGEASGILRQKQTWRHISQYNGHHCQVRRGLPA